MACDFTRSGERHFKAAALLDEHAQIADAAHLYGLASECGIKAVLIGTGAIQTNEEGDIEKREHRKHMDELLPLLQTLGAGRKWPMYYRMIEHEVGCFATWSVFDRYKSEAAISLTDYVAWKEAAKRVERMFNLAKLEGCAR